MRERETPSDSTEESGRRRISIAAWILAVVVSFALGGVVTHLALLQQPISQFSFQTFLAGPFWSTASIALACFVLGIGFTYVPFSWFRDDANRTLRTEYSDLRDKAVALRQKADAPQRDRAEMSRPREPARPAKPVEAPEPEYAEGDDGPPDIAAVLSEMSSAIKANLRDAGPSRPAPARPAGADSGPLLRAKPPGE